MRSVGVELKLNEIIWSWYVMYLPFSNATRVIQNDDLSEQDYS
jgi:hypothetical protein